jgi:hypothetical protein
MPLNPAGLQADLEALASGPGAAIADCAQLWADAVQAYAIGVVPPSTTLAAASSALQAALAAAFAQPSAAASMESAFTTFAAALGPGMAPAFVAVPPPGPVGFATLFAEPYPSTHADAATAVSSAIDTWMRTGTATPSAGGASAPWA